MYPYLRLGPFLLQLPLCVLLLGLWIGSSLTEREASRLKISTAVINNLIFFGFISGIVGARLGYAARYLQVYLENPMSLLALNVNTLSNFDGFLIGIAVAAIYAWRKKLYFRSTLDALAPGIAVFMIFLGAAHLLSGDAFGAPTNLPWSIYLWDEYRHPSQIYEILVAGVIFYITTRRLLGQVGNGTNFLLLVFLTSIGRMFLEAFKGDSMVWLGGLRTPQIVSLIITLMSLYMIHIWARTPITTSSSDQTSIKNHYQTFEAE